MTGELVVATYNVHQCVGSDLLCNPERVAEVVAELDADVVGLQEVDSRLPEHGVDQLAFLALATGYRAIAGPTLMRHMGAYGNGLLVRRRPVLGVRRLDLSVAGFEPRGALDVDVDVDGVLVRVVATHLGLRRAERSRQTSLLVAALEALSRPATILLGDINEWLPGSGARRVLDGRLGKTSCGPTYPARWPVLGLDQVWVAPRAAMREVAVHKSRLAKEASDHLPLLARLDLAAMAVRAARAG